MRFCAIAFLLALVVACDSGVDDDDFDSLVSRVDAAESTIVTQAAQIAALETQNDDLEDRINALEATAGVDPAEFTDLEARVTTSEAAIVAVQSESIANASVLTAATDFFAYVSIDSGNATISFDGANVEILNGTGETYAANGLGNLTLGYSSVVRSTGVCGTGSDEGDFCLDDASCDGLCDLSIPFERTGSHNIYVGDGHTSSGNAGLLAGLDATSSADNTTTLSVGNSTAGEGATVTGGAFNSASGTRAAVCGGNGNIAAGTFSVVSAGSNNAANGRLSAVSGGTQNIAEGTNSTVSGGGALTAGTTNEHLP